MAKIATNGFPKENGDHPMQPKNQTDFMVIKCPSCRSKFALPSESLDGIEFPRFHCSRCDHIFSKEESLCKVTPAKTDPTTKHESLDFEIDPWTDEAEPDEESWTLGSDPSPKENSQLSLEVPRTFDMKRPISAPHENVRAETAREKNNKPTSSQMELDFSATNQFPNPIEDDSWAAIQLEGSNREKEMQFNYRDDTDPAPDKALAKLPAQIAWQALLHQRPAVWKGCLMLTAPIVLFLMVLWGLGQLLESSPQSAAWISRLIVPNGERVAPEGLFISGLKQRKVDLEDGESVRLISGTLENRSKEDFEEVQLEALTFDKSGKRLSSLKVHAGSTMANTRVKSLSLALIDELQSRPPAKRFELKSDETSDFAIALPFEEGEEAHYYTARVYSVRKKQGAE
ncbi:MAG: hypothetical protein GX589_00850 [Deltaproteobacteria bacterium]|nr:hypothetical protein [Deltaproteobacteria bacterium]